jgi:hypothetical protein
MLMRRINFLAIGGSLFYASALVCLGGVKAEVNFNDPATATADFKFSTVPSPSATDAASKATFYIVTGQKDEQSGDLIKLHDGKLPGAPGDAGESFAFKPGTKGGRFVIDLGRLMDVKQINSYSWDSGTHAAQVYTVYGSDGKARNFTAEPFREGGPQSSGWKKIAKVDTRPAQGDGAGQYGVSLSDSKGVIDTYRYIMFDFSPTETDDAQGNTFLSEIDIVDANAPATASAVKPALPKIGDGVESAKTVELADVSR